MRLLPSLDVVVLACRHPLPTAQPTLPDTHHPPHTAAASTAAAASAAAVAVTAAAAADHFFNTVCSLTSAHGLIN